VTSNNTKIFNPNDPNDNIIACKLNTDYGEKTINIYTDKTLSDFEAELKKEVHFNNLEFRRWNHSVIAKGNLAQDALSDITFIQIEKMEWQILDRIKSKEDLIEEDLQNLDIVSKGFSQQISNEKHLISDNILEIYRKLQSFSTNNDTKANMELYEMALQLYSIQTHFYNEVNQKLMDNSDPKAFQNLLNQYYELKKVYSRLLYEEQQTLKKSARKAKFLIFLGGFLFVIQLVLIYYLTFVKFSWDITEPMTYLTACTNVFLVCLLKLKFKQQTPFQYFQMGFFRKTKFFKTDFLKMNKLKDEISKIENKLN